MTNAQNKHEADAHTATHKKPRAFKIFVGQVVSATSSKLIMTTMNGKEHTHTVSKDAKFTCDGETCRPESLKHGSRIRVTTLKDGRNFGTRIESLDKYGEFPTL